MKTTSYEISKKLKEAGFDAEGDFGYRVPDSLNDLKAYSLETLLDALPDSIQYKNEYKISDWYYLFLGAPSRLGYYCECHEYRDNYSMGNGIFEISKLSPNESLADTAGRMWLMLKEKGMVW